MSAAKGNKYNPKGHPVNLVPGNPLATGRKPWCGPEPEWFEGLLAKISDGANATGIIKSELDCSYDTFLCWLDRSGNRERYEKAFLSRIDGERFKILELADDPANDVQRAKLQIDTRWRVMQSLDARFRPKQDINLSSADSDALLLALKKLDQ